MLNSEKEKKNLHSEKLAQRGTETPKTFIPFKIHVPLLPHMTSLGFTSHAIAKTKQIIGIYVKHWDVSVVCVIGRLPCISCDKRGLTTL